MILFDTDLGLGTPNAELDDGAALMVLARRAREQLAGITVVHGNVTVGLALQNAARMQAYLSIKDVPLGRGQALPLLQDPSWFADFQAKYGITPPWPTAADLPWAVDLILDTVRANPGQVTLLAVGPLTNLAMALRLEPELPKLVKQVVSMGGNLDSDEPEFNVRCDPEAAQIVYEAGWPLKLIGLEITRQILFTRADFEEMLTDAPVNHLLVNQSSGWISRVEAEGWETGGCSLHDALAVAAALQPDMFEFKTADISVVLDDTVSRGSTRVALKDDPDGQPQVAVAVDHERSRTFIMDALIGR
jgi:inosine-uridine nucleoside N-ribohydrolase